MLTNLTAQSESNIVLQNALSTLRHYELHVH